MPEVKIVQDDGPKLQLATHSLPIATRLLLRGYCYDYSTRCIMRSASRFKVLLASPSASFA